MKPVTFLRLRRILSIFLDFHAFAVNFIRFSGFLFVFVDFHPFFRISILLVTISIRFSGFSSCWRRFSSVFGDFHPFAAIFILLESDFIRLWRVSIFRRELFLFFVIRFLKIYRLTV